MSRMGRNQGPPPGYNRCAERVAALIQEWVETVSSYRFVDLRFKDWGRTVYAGSVVEQTVDYLADSPDARTMLLWVGERERGATLLMTCVVLETLGYKKMAAHLEQAERERMN